MRYALGTLLLAWTLGAASPAGAQAPNAAELARGQVHLRGHRGLRVPHPAQAAGQQRGAQVRWALRHRLLDQHHPRSQDRDRLLDGRPDHHGHPARPPAQWRAAPAGAPLHRLQRHGRGRPQGRDRLSPQPAAGQPREPAEEDLRAPLRVGVPAGLAGRLCPPARRRRPPRPPPAFRAASTWYAPSAIAASAIPRAP